TIGDILALDRVPGRVVLSSCESARSDVDAPTAGVAGLAQAFLAVGSHSVIAATRPIADETARALAEALYPALLSAGTDPAALRQAQLTLYRRQPRIDWASFRAFEP
ncbi:MAG: CHAT domain-containing protein, partial [Acidobacteriota bacterium]